MHVEDSTKKSHSNTTEYFKKYIFYAPLMKMVILRTSGREVTLFRTHFFESLVS
jgi:hypothetical protein